jgi:putative transposase
MALPLPRRVVPEIPAEGHHQPRPRRRCNEHHVELLEAEAMPDHIHLLVSVDPQFGIHRLIRLLKGRSSRLLRQEFPSLRRRLPTLWTNSYFVATVGGAPLSIIKQYVSNQRHV